MRGRLVWLALATLLLPACGEDGPPSAETGEELSLGTETVATPRAPERPATSTARAPAPRAPRALRAARPPITVRAIPFGPERVEQTAEYSRRHYGAAKTRLEPRVIVEHYTVLPSVEQVVSLFSANRPDAELHELPGVCSHYLVDRDGTILQLVPPERICRHTVGLNDVAIGIEHVGASDSEVLGNRAQLEASLRLTAWLRCRNDIAVGDVIGHAESLTSPHHHERVRRLQNQTHDDFKQPAMKRYRERLARIEC